MSPRFVILCGISVVLFALTACGAPDAAWDTTRKTINGETFDPVPQDPVAPSDRIRLDHPSHRGGADSLDAATPDTAANADEQPTTATDDAPMETVRQPFEAPAPVAPVPARERPSWHRGDVLR